MNENAYILMETRPSIAVDSDFWKRLPGLLREAYAKQDEGRIDSLVQVVERTGKEELKKLLREEFESKRRGHVLHIAVKYGCLKMVNALLKVAEDDAQLLRLMLLWGTQFGWAPFPFLLSAQYGHHCIVKRLVDAAKHLDPSHNVLRGVLMSAHRWSMPAAVLYIASKSGHGAVVRALLDEAASIPDENNTLGHVLLAGNWRYGRACAFHCAVARKDHAMVGTFITAAQGINDQYHTMKKMLLLTTPGHEASNVFCTAVHNKDDQMVCMLITAAKRINDEDTTLKRMLLLEGAAVFRVALAVNSIKMISKLIQATKEVNHGSEILRQVLLSTDSGVDEVSDVLNHIAFHGKDEVMAMFIEAVHSVSDLRLLQKLLLAEYLGQPAYALRIAAERKHHAVVYVLIKAAHAIDDHCSTLQIMLDELFIVDQSNAVGVVAMLLKNAVREKNIALVSFLLRHTGIKKRLTGCYIFNVEECLGSSLFQSICSGELLASQLSYETRVWFKRLLAEYVMRHASDESVGIEYIMKEESHFKAFMCYREWLFPDSQLRRLAIFLEEQGVCVTDKGEDVLNPLIPAGSAQAPPPSYQKLYPDRVEVGNNEGAQLVEDVGAQLVEDIRAAVASAQRMSKAAGAPLLFMSEALGKKAGRNDDLQTPLLAAEEEAQEGVASGVPARDITSTGLLQKIARLLPPAPRETNDQLREHILSAGTHDEEAPLLTL